MYLSELLAALSRRWWLVALGLMATLGLCFAAYTLVPPEDDIHATMLVLPPETTTEVVHNPLLALGDLPPAADVLARAMNSGDVSDQLVPPGSTGSYQVVRDSSTSGPVLAITASDRTPEQAKALLDAVIARIPEEFATLQSTIQVQAPATMKVTLLSRESKTTESTKSQIRAVVMAGVAGIALTIFGASLLDGLLRRRKADRRRSRPKGALRVEPTQEPSPLDEPAAAVAPADSPATFVEPLPFPEPPPLALADPPVPPAETRRQRADTVGVEVVAPRRFVTAPPQRDDAE